MALPNQYMGDQHATNLTSTATHQYAVWYTVAGETIVGKRNRATQVWGVNHEQFAITGAARTALAMPVDPDEHNWPCIIVGPTGHLHVFANMHCDPLRAIRSTNAGDITAWTALSAMPGQDAQTVAHTYPYPVTFSDGEVLLYMRSNPGKWGSGRSNSFLWRMVPGATAWSGMTMIFQGLDLPGGGSGWGDASAASDTATNWSAYPQVPVVDGNDRVHMHWVWRQYANSPAFNQALPVEQQFSPDHTNFLPSYAYSDDKGATWRAVDGTLLTLPITPLNNPSCRIPFTRPATVTNTTPEHSGGYVNGGGLTIDGNGYPVALIHTNPWYVQRWTGSAWTQTSFSGSLAGVAPAGLGVPIWFKNELWYLIQGTTSGDRHVRLYKASGTASVRLGGPVPPAGVWTPTFDREAYRRWGVVETLVPDGDTPAIFEFGAGARLSAA